MSRSIVLDPAIAKGKVAPTFTCIMSNFANSMVALKPGDKVIEVQQYGTSSWASTARVDVQTTDGSPGAYFLKARFILSTITKFKPWEAD